MHGVGAARDRRRDDGFLVQIGFRRVRGTDLDRFIGEPGGEHLPVGRAHDLNGPDAELASPRG